MAFVAFALIGGLVVASALCALAFHRAIKRQQREAALHAPLLDRFVSLQYAWGWTRYRSMVCAY